MKHNLFSKSRNPLYLQLAEELRQRITKGQWATGELLPTLNELMKEFGVSRVTVRQALMVLSDDGLVKAQRGVGTAVISQSSSNQTLKLGTCLNDLLKTYQDDCFELIELLDKPIKLPDNISYGTPFNAYRKIRRLQKKDGKSYCIATMYVAETVFLRNANRYMSELVLPVLFDDQNISITTGKQIMTISKCNFETSQLLDISVGDPTADITRILCDKNGNIIFLAELIHRGDFIQLEVQLTP